MKTKKLFLLITFVLVLSMMLVTAVACDPDDPSSGSGSSGSSGTVSGGSWTYSYQWDDGKCTATRVIEGTNQRESEVADGVLTVLTPATKTQSGSGYYTVKFKKSEFNANYNLGNQSVDIPAGSAFTYAKAGLNTYFFGNEAGKYYYAEMHIGSATQAGWVGFVHNVGDSFSDDGTYFFDAVSYKAGKNYEHAFGSVIDGENLYDNTESADSYEGVTKKGLTGADFANDGMTVVSIRNNELIHLFINGKRVATYLVDDEISSVDTIPGLYFNTNSTFYSGEISEVDVVVGQDATQAKLNALMEDNNGFMYSNSQNWNKNDGLHTGAEFNNDSFNYVYDADLDLSDIVDGTEGYTHDRRFMSGVTDRVFLAGNYYYQYEITDLTGIQDSKNYGLFFNWINSAQRNGVFYKHEAMLCLKDNGGLEKVHFDEGNGTNGDGVAGWIGGTAFGGSDSLKSDSQWQAAYKQGLIVRIERIASEEGISSTYRMSVSVKNNSELVLASTDIVVDAEDKIALYGGYDWVLFGTQSVNCIVSNVTYGRIHNYAAEGTVVTPATCGEDGVIRYYCTDEGFTDLYIEDVIPATGNHDYDYQYTWNPLAPTSDGIAECRAYRECSVCHDHDEETVSASYQITTAPTNEDGAGLYTATFSKNYFVEQTKPIVISKDEHVHNWAYSYSWEGIQCTAVRDCAACSGHEEETVDGTLVSIISPARKDAEGKAIYDATFAKADFNVNDTESVRISHTAAIAAGTAFSIGEAGRQVYTFEDIEASRYYYIEVQLGATVNLGWVGLIHSVDGNNYFYDAVSYSSTDNYTHSFADVIGGEGRIYSEPASYYEGVTKSGLTGADFGTNGMKLATLRVGEYIHTYINNKRIATYLVNDSLALADSVPALYFNDNNGYYDGSVSEIIVISGQSDVESKLAELNAGSSFGYANTPNWNKNNGTHTDAIFSEGGFRYQYDSSYTVPSGGTNDRRYLTGVTDRVFFSGNYYYQYEITEITSVNTNLFYNWINPAATIEGYHYHEAMFCIQANGDGMKRISFNEGSGTNGDGIGGWVGGNAGGGFSDYSNAAWKNTSYYESGLIVRIERIGYVAGESSTYRMSVTSKADPSLTITSKDIVVSAENKQSVYGGYDWILFGMQILNCKVSNVIYGRIHNYAAEGTVVTPATCGEDGVIRYYCTDEGFTDLYIEDVIPATGNHDYECTYVWNPTEPQWDGTASCTAVGICMDCSHREEDSVQGVFSTIEAPGAGKDGKGQFKATFTKSCFAEQTVDVDIPASAHICDYDYSYVWSSDYSSCTATRVCDCGDRHEETVDSVVTVINPATKDQDGLQRYTVTFEDELFNNNAEAEDLAKEESIPAGTAFSISNAGKQTYTFKNVDASKYYYIEVKLGAALTQGYVGIAHVSDNGNKYFYDAVSYSESENYIHVFGSIINEEGREYKEEAKYYEGATKSGLTGADFGTTGMTLATLRDGSYIHTYVNGKRIATYLVEDDIASIDTVPVLYFNDNTTYYNGQVGDIVIVKGQESAEAKLAELNAGSSFDYVNTPNWDTSKGTHTDASFNDNGFIYQYDSSVSAGDRRFVTGVNDRTFFAGDYYYQYEITDINWASVNNGYGLFFSWVNTKSKTDAGYYKHEANFCMKLDSESSNKLDRLTFDKGSGANGDGVSNWVSNTTAYGGRNNLSGNSDWQSAREGGLIVRIERRVKNSTTDVYKMSVTAKNNSELVIQGTEIEVSDATYGGYNWILFGTQSVNCTVSNVSYGRI